MANKKTDPSPVDLTDAQRRVLGSAYERHQRAQQAAQAAAQALNDVCVAIAGDGFRLAAGRDGIELYAGE